MSRFAKWFNLASNGLVNAWKDSSGFERKLYQWMLIVAGALVAARCAASSIRHAGYEQGVEDTNQIAAVRNELRLHRAVDSTAKVGAQIKADADSARHRYEKQRQRIVIVDDTTVRVDSGPPVHEIPVSLIVPPIRACDNLDTATAKLDTADVNKYAALVADRDAWKDRAVSAEAKNRKASGHHWYDTPVKVGLFLGGVYVGAKVIR